jgi:hypothetical protein
VCVCVCVCEREREREKREREKWEDGLVLTWSRYIVCLVIFILIVNPYNIRHVHIRNTNASKWRICTSGWILWQVWFRLIILVFLIILRSLTSASQ